MDNYFTNEEIEHIISTDKVNNYTRNTLDIKTHELFNYFISKKIKNISIKKMILDYPRILTLSLEILKENYNNVDKIFKKNTNKLLISNSRILSRDIETFNNRIKYFINLGLTKANIIKIFLECPTIVTVSELNLDISIENLIDKIEDKEKVIKLISSTSSILSHSIKNINDKFIWFYKKGYSKEQTAHIVCKANTILTMEFEKKTDEKEANNTDSNIERKYKYLSDYLDYTKKEIIEITSKFPEYYTLSLNTIKTRIDNLIKLGFDKNIVKTIFYNYPQIISFKEDTLNKKYNYYLNLNMIDIFRKKPEYLMQNIELTDARYRYLINKGLEINKNNYGKLFVSDKRFKKNYGISNYELLKEYRENGGYYGQGTNKRNTIKSRKRFK